MSKIIYNDTTILDTETGTYTLTTKGNYLSGNIKVVNPEEGAFDWGDETGDADEEWFANLATYLKNHYPNPSWVGMQKSVTLDDAVLGTTTHQIVCIGVDQDGDNTVTFQTLNCLATTSAFSSLPSDSSHYARGSNYHDSANLIYDGNTLGACKLYYNAFPGKSYIKAVNKGTVTVQHSSRNGTATYTSQYVWIPSEYEVGLDSYSSLSAANSTTSNCECT